MGSSDSTVTSIIKLWNLLVLQNQRNFFEILFFGRSSDGSVGISSSFMRLGLPEWNGEPRFPSIFPSARPVYRHKAATA